MRTERSIRARATVAIGRAAAALLVLIAGCVDLLDVSAPDVIQPSDLANADGAAALRSGAIARFVYAINGTNADGRGLVGMSALLSDEFTSAMRTNNTSDDASDKRQVLDPGLSVPYNLMQQAYVSLLMATSEYQRLLPTRRTDIAETFALIGFIQIAFAEDFCSGVPLSTVDGTAIEFGKPNTTVAMRARALANFDSALAYAGSSTTDRIANLARVGRGRVLLDMGRLPEADQAVTGVAVDFSYATQQSGSIQANGVYNRMFQSRYWSVSDVEGANGLNFLSAKDPRVPTQLIGTSTSDGKTPVHGFSRYATGDAPIVIASGTEARLISAEARLKAGDGAGALAILNQLRAGTSGLAPLALATSDAARVDQLFRERAFWLYGTAHRLGDLRRLVRQYARAPDAVYPKGVYGDGSSLYGTAIGFAPDAVELNNPNYTGCIDRLP